MTASTSDRDDVAARPPRRTVWLRRLRRGVLLYAVIPYLVIATLFAVLQRQFIYPRARVPVIRPADARLSDGQVHAVTIRTADNLQLNGWLVLADGHTAETSEDCNRQLEAGRPVVLYFPGNAGNRTHRGRDCCDFTGLPMDILLFDYRGYGENPGSPSEEALAADARVVWDYATTTRGISPNRIVVFGESLGGGVATRLVAEMCQAGTPPAGLIVSSTFSSMTDTAAWHYPYFPVRLMLLDRYPSHEKIGSVTCPISVIHGMEDEFVPVDLARKLFRAAPQKSATGVEKEWIELPHVGHNEIPRGAIRKAAQRIVDAIDM